MGQAQAIQTSIFSTPPHGHGLSQNTLAKGEAMLPAPLSTTRLWSGVDSSPLLTLSMEYLRALMPCSCTHCRSLNGRRLTRPLRLCLGVTATALDIQEEPTHLAAALAATPMAVAETIVRVSPLERWEALLEELLPSWRSLSLVSCVGTSGESTPRLARIRRTRRPVSTAWRNITGPEYHPQDHLHQVSTPLQDSTSRSSFRTRRFSIHG